MSREAREARAGARGDRPVAPAWTGLGAVFGGLCASVVAVLWLAPWSLLERALEAEQAPDLAPVLGAVLLVPLGALAGALLAAQVAGPTPFRLRGRWRPARGTRGTVVWVGLVVLGAAALTPRALFALVTSGDPGGVWVAAPGVALGLGLLLCAPVALVDRAWGRAAWRERVHPDPPPRRDEDAPPPEVAAAVRASAQPPGAV